jgi:membrane-associated phospholipid phosphatase
MARYNARISALGKMFTARWFEIYKDKKQQVRDRSETISVPGCEGNFSAVALKQTRALSIWLIAILLGVLLVIVAFSLDESVHRWQQQHVLKNSALLRRNITRVTDWPVHVVAGLVLAAFARWRGNKKWTRIFVSMIAAGALAGTSAYVLKVATGRVRPSVAVEKVWGRPGLQQNYQSFPSGHTAFSAGFFAALFIGSWRIGLFCLPIPIFVAFTRVFLGAHYLSDVVVAFILGILSAILIAHLMLRAERGAPVPGTAR